MLLSPTPLWGRLNSSVPICRLIAYSFFQFCEDKRNDFIRVCGHKVIRAAKREVTGKNWQVEPFLVQQLSKKGKVNPFL